MIALVKPGAALRAARLRLVVGEVARMDDKRRRLDRLRRELEARCSDDLGSGVVLRGQQLLSALDRAEGQARRG